MKVLFEKVNLGATYQGTTYDFRIYIKTESGLELILFDPGFDLRKYEGKEMDCLILAFYVSIMNAEEYKKKSYDIRHPFLKGEFIENYKIQKKWHKFSKAYEEFDYPAVKTDDGIMPIEFCSEKDKDNLKEGDFFTFTVGRLDLCGWFLID